MLVPELALRDEDRRTASPVKVATSAEELSPRVQEAVGGLGGAAKEVLLTPSVGSGLGVPATLMSEGVGELCSPRGRHESGRTGYRHGSEASTVTLGGVTSSHLSHQVDRQTGTREKPEGIAYQGTARVGQRSGAGSSVSSMS